VRLEPLAKQYVINIAARRRECIWQGAFRLASAALRGPASLWNVVVPLALSAFQGGFFIWYPPWAAFGNTSRRPFCLSLLKLHVLRTSSVALFERVPCGIHIFIFRINYCVGQVGFTWVKLGFLVTPPRGSASFHRFRLIGTVKTNLCFRYEGKQGKRVNWLFLMIPTWITISIESSRDLFIDMFVVRVYLQK